MRTIAWSRIALITLPLLALSGCASHGMHRAHHEGGQGMHGKKDMHAMCAQHGHMMGATPEQRRAMMEEHLKTMSPEMKQQHLQMMREQVQMLEQHMQSQGR
ncbi:MAG TPA: hypothetical protein VIG66_06855 [Noviherbaspirillum sp.]